MKKKQKYCNKEIVVKFNNISSFDKDVILYDGWSFYPWTYEILDENKTKVVIEQSETGQKLSLFSNKTPILSPNNSLNLIQTVLEKLDFGLSVVIKNKILEREDTMEVGNLNGSKILVIYDEFSGYTCYEISYFTDDKYEILEILK